MGIARWWVEDLEQTPEGRLVRDDTPPAPCPSTLSVSRDECVRLQRDWHVRSHRVLLASLIAWCESREFGGISATHRRRAPAECVDVGAGERVGLGLNPDVGGVEELGARSIAAASALGRNCSIARMNPARLVATSQTRRSPSPGTAEEGTGVRDRRLGHEGPWTSGLHVSPILDSYGLLADLHHSQRFCSEGTTVGLWTDSRDEFEAVAEGGG